MPRAACVRRLRRGGCGYTGVVHALSRRPYGQPAPRPFAVDAALERRRRTRHRAARTEHGRATYEQIARARHAHGGGLVLDSGCGTGEGTRALAARHPDALVVGVDKSADRLARGGGPSRSGALLVRGDVVELWSRMAEAGWRVDAHYLLYPNPWPKPSQLRRRWYGHPAFCDLLAISRRIETRTNWEVYARELAHAFERATWRARLRAIAAPVGLTAFERKYAASGHQLWSVLAAPG